MYRLTGILSSTNVDRQGDRMTLSALEDGVEQINAGYLPFGVEHDPRIAPIGRVVAGRIKKLADGEYGLEGEIEIFEPGDDLSLRNDDRQIPLRKYQGTKLQVVYDMGFEDERCREVIAELSKQFGTEPIQEFKKSLEPIAVLAFGAIYIIGHIAAGFLSNLGKDGYESFKARIGKLISHRQSKGKDTLFELSMIVHKNGYEVEVNLLCKNPSESDIAEIVNRQLQRIDDALPSLIDSQPDIRKLNFEHENGDLHIRFAVRRDAVPLYPQPFDP